MSNPQIPRLCSRMSLPIWPLCSALRRSLEPGMENVQFVTEVRHVLISTKCVAGRSPGISITRYINSPVQFGPAEASALGRGYALHDETKDTGGLCNQISRRA